MLARYPLRIQAHAMQAGPHGCMVLVEAAQPNLHRSVYLMAIACARINMLCFCTPQTPTFSFDQDRFLATALLCVCSLQVAPSPFRRYRCFQLQRTTATSNNRRTVWYTHMCRMLVHIYVQTVLLCCSKHLTQSNLCASSQANDTSTCTLSTLLRDAH